MKPPKKTWADRRMAASKPLRARLLDSRQEHLIGCAIRRAGVEYGRERQFRAHSEIRRMLGDPRPYEENRGDEHGFITSRDRFVGRVEAYTIAALMGQTAASARPRALLSSDVSQWGKPK